jgi:hypothetical protein
MYNPFGLPLIYNPLGPWNAWFAFSTQPARIWTATLCGMAEGWSKVAETGRSVTDKGAETGRRVTDNIIDAEARFAEAASRSTKRRAAAKRRKGHIIRSGRVEPRVKKHRRRRRA